MENYFNINYWEFSVVNLDAYQGYPETNRSTQIIDTGSGYDITNDNDYGVVRRPKYENHDFFLLQYNH